MKKRYIFLIAFVSLISVLWIVGRVTNSFQIFKISSASMKPTLKEGAKFFVSKLKKPERFDLICFNTESEQTGKYMAVSQLCAIAGDVVEIKSGDLV